MPISIKKDVKPLFGFGSSFRLRQTPYFFLGSYLDFVRGAVADQNYDEFHGSWNWLQGTLDLLRVNRDLTKALARKYNLGRQIDEDIFDDLWPIIKDARAYNKKNKVENDIADQLEEAYGFAARLADGRSLPGNPPTWSRVAPPRSDQNLVIFSDHHLTTFSTNTLQNYFKDFNRALYLDVLNHYANRDYCLVENGDVEECVIYDVELDDAKDRRRAAKNFPIIPGEDRWDEFLDLRYAKRTATLQRVLNEFRADYYTLLRDRFIANDKFVRLTGNHDTYLNEFREQPLRNLIEGELGTAVYDVLPIHRGGAVAYLVMHGHQFDTVSIQHGDIPYAKSLGEVYSEATAWIYQGPDRFWTESDTKLWINGEPFQNMLAREEAGTYSRAYPRVSVYDTLVDKAQADLIEKTDKALDNIKADPQDWIETLLGHEIAWEYFENDDAFNALALEVWTGEEWFKFRHLNERDLCARYSAEYLDLTGPPFSRPIPKLVLGHTHEPRQNAVNPVTGDEAYYYLNSGSAGRFQNLIWCVEITGATDQIVSWSRVDGRLKKIIWRSEHTSTTFPGPFGPVTGHSSTLVHDRTEWY